MCMLICLPGGSVVKNLPAIQELQETQVPALGKMIPRRRAWQPTPVLLPGQRTWTEESGGLQSNGSQRVRHDWARMLFFHSTLVNFHVFILFQVSLYTCFLNNLFMIYLLLFPVDICIIIPFKIFICFIYGCTASLLLSTGLLYLRQAGLLLLACGSRASHGCGFSCWGTQALEPSSCSMWAPEHTGLATQSQLESSGTRDWTYVLSTGRQILIHCVTKEVPTLQLLRKSPIIRKKLSVLLRFFHSAIPKMTIHSTWNFDFSLYGSKTAAL